MNTISVKLEQTKVKSITIVKGTPKFDNDGEKIKDENGKVIYSIDPIKERVTELISIESNDIFVEQISDIQGQTEAVTQIINGLSEAVNYALQGGSSVVLIAGKTFNLGGKFSLYVRVNGQDYCFDNDVTKQFKGQQGLTHTLKKPQQLLNELFAVIRATEGQSSTLPKGTISNVKLLS